jgi:omega-6 fatty acid desaturase (delta-12 desaturase)
VQSNATTPRAWRKVLATYQQPRLGRSLFEIAVTVVPLAAIWALAWVALERAQWITALLLTIPAAGFLVRLFLIQHDCGHGSFFTARAANDWVGRVIGVLTLTPYEYWRRTHAVHHATSGNLDRRSLGAVEMLTVEEYRALSPLKRLGYRLYRHPLVMFGIGPAYMFILQHRLPIGVMKQGAWGWLSVMGNNLGVALFAAVMIWAGGPAPFLLIYLPTMVVAAMVGVWLFFVQHQFEATYWERNPGWTADEAALRGSSYYRLPGVLRWMTANIGVHHVHHVGSRIPFYRLTEALKDHPELETMSRLGLKESFDCVKLTLWDEAAGRMVSFREARLASA